jgi:site-specific recombinase XerC
MLTEVERFHKWLRRRSPGASTHVHYVSDVNLFLAWLSKPPARVTARDVDAYIEDAQARGHATATVNRRLAALRSFYAFPALESDDAPGSPVIPRRHFIRQGEHLPRDLEDAAVERLLAVVTRPRDWAMFLLMVRCGLRVGEVRNLSLGDLYLQAAPGKLPRLWLHGKNGKQRVAFLSAQPLAALKDWLDLRPITSDEAVFVNRFGRRLTVTGIQKRITGYAQRVGLHLTCHQLRHTFGRQMAESRVPVTSIQRLLGHSRLRTTEVYIHISDQQVQSDYEAAMAVITRRLGQGGATL